MSFLIDGIKVNIVNYPYHWLRKPKIVNNLILADIIDIASMKLSAITGRGTKKDFIDLFFILKHFKIEKIIDFYKGKYPDGSVFLVLKSLLYFDDADNKEPIEIISKESWKSIKSFIKKTVENYLKQIQ